MSVSTYRYKSSSVPGMGTHRRIFDISGVKVTSYGSFWCWSVSRMSRVHCMGKRGREGGVGEREGGREVGERKGGRWVRR